MSPELIECAVEQPLQPTSGMMLCPRFNSFRNELLVRRSRLSGMTLDGS